MVMKQSLTAGTVDNISCIFICFNNLKQIMQQKFLTKNIQTIETRMPYDIKDEYSNPSNKESLTKVNFDEIRKRIAFMKEDSIHLRKNEDIKLTEFEISSQNIYVEKKPKTSSDALKSNRIELINANFPDEINNTINNYANFDYGNNNLNTDANSNNEMDKFLYKIGAKKNKTPGIAPIKNYEATLPTFKISQKLNKIPKELNNIKSVSPANRIFPNTNSSKSNNVHSFINNQNYGTNNNMNLTSKNSRFLPKINNKNFSQGNQNNLQGGERNSSNGGYKYSKGLQFNFNLNK